MAHNEWVSNVAIELPINLCMIFGQYMGLFDQAELYGLFVLFQICSDHHLCYLIYIYYCCFWIVWVCVMSSWISLCMHWMGMCI